MSTHPGFNKSETVDPQVKGVTERFSVKVKIQIMVNININKCWH